MVAAMSATPIQLAAALLRDIFTKPLREAVAMWLPF